MRRFPSERIPHWKNFVIVLTPLILLPLPIIYKGKVKCFIHFYSFSVCPAAIDAVEKNRRPEQDTLRS